MLSFAATVLHWLSLRLTWWKHLWLRASPGANLPCANAPSTFEGPLSARSRPTPWYSSTRGISLQGAAFGGRGSRHHPHLPISFSHAMVLGHYVSTQALGLALTWFDLLNFSVHKVNTLPRRRKVGLLHCTSQWQGRVNMVVTCPEGAFRSYSSNKPAFLIGQGFVSISLVNLLKGLLGKHMKNNCYAQQRIA